MLPGKQFASPREDRRNFGKDLSHLSPPSIQLPASRLLPTQPHGKIPSEPFQSCEGGHDSKAVGEEEAARKNQSFVLGWGPWGMSASLAYLERFVFYNEQQRRRGEDRRDRPKAALWKRGGRRLVRSGEGGWKSTWDMYAVPKGENQERERGDSRQWLGLLNMAGAPGRSRRGAVVRVCLEADGRMK